MAYDAWFADPRSWPVHEALARISLTGKIKKPLVTLHGTLDALLPIGTDSDVYAQMIADEHRDRLHRYYRIEGGNHVDSLMHLDPEHLRPMLPCFRTAFDALTAWAEDGQEPPPSATVPRPAGNGAGRPPIRRGSSPSCWPPRPGTSGHGTSPSCAGRSAASSTTSTW